ncbi:MAG: ABC transporter ATP-binding protein/permease [Clostridia bacterium]|nr:ABC transporter ATP-binding protein/permease [Clostridia bacterium]
MKKKRINPAVTEEQTDANAANAAAAGQKKPGTFRRVIHELGPYKWFVVLSLVLAIVTVAGNLIVPILFGDIVNDVIDTSGFQLSAMAFGTEMDGMTLLWIYIGIIIAVVIITAVCQWLMGVINNFIVYNTVRDVRKRAFAHIQGLPLSYIDSNAIGDIVSRNITDVETFADGLILGFTQLFTGVMTIIGTLVLMIVYNWIIAVVVVVLTPISLLVARFIATHTYSMFKKTSEIRGEETGFIEEMIGNQKTVQAFGREDENNETFDEINGRLTDAALKSTFYSSLTNPSTRFINAIIYAIVAFVGAMSIIYPGMLPVAFSVGRLTTLLSYANQYAKPFNEISEVVTELQNALACAKRVYDLTDEPEQSPDGPGELGKVHGSVTFEGVDFSYDKDRELIKNLNITALAGKRIAIVGPTGCGKTTMINLLMRFYDTDAGRITVDGVDTRDITRHSLRRNFGMVLQETWLRSGTVRENICMARPDATEEEMIRAAKAAHSHNFIMQLENGYDTVIGEEGGSLSQGQKQLLCITRVMLALPPMLILDEATSSIDARTEIRIQKAFNRLMEGRTSFVVAHRLSTIQHSDLILVMRDGKVIEQGTHEELLAQHGFYYDLYNSQFAIY